MAQVNLNLSDVPDSELDRMGGSWEAVPDGEYVCVCVETDYKQTSKGTGYYIALRHEIVYQLGVPRAEAERYRGAALFDNFNVVNQSEKAMAIGRRQAKQLAVAQGHPDPNNIRDTEEYRRSPFVAVVECLDVGTGQPGADHRGLKNNVIGYKPMPNQQAPQQPATQPPPPAAAPQAQQPPPQVPQPWPQQSPSPNPAQGQASPPAEQDPFTWNPGDRSDDIPF